MCQLATGWRDLFHTQRHSLFHDLDLSFDIDRNLSCFTEKAKEFIEEDRFGSEIIGFFRDNL